MGRWHEEDEKGKRTQTMREKARQRETEKSGEMGRPAHRAQEVLACGPPAPGAPEALPTP